MPVPQEEALVLPAKSLFSLRITPKTSGREPRPADDAVILD